MSRNSRLWIRSTVPLAAIMVILMLVPGAWAASKYKVLYQFEGHSDGSGPDAGLIFDPAGNLYSTTTTGGSGRASTAAARRS